MIWLFIVIFIMQLLNLVWTFMLNQQLRVMNTYVQGLNGAAWDHPMRKTPGAFA